MSDDNKLRIWHIINFPGPAFRKDVPDVPTAIKALKAISTYDLFLGDGEDKPWSTVGGRRKKQEELAGNDKFLRSLFVEYNRYQLDRCPGGVPIVVCNVQGLEAFEKDEDEWCEYYDENGDDIRAIEAAQSSPAEALG